MIPLKKLLDANLNALQHVIKLVMVIACIVATVRVPGHVTENVLGLVMELATGKLI